MARFEGSINPSAHMARFEGSIATSDDRFRDALVYDQRAGEGQAHAILTCDEGTIEVRMRRTANNVAMMDIWVTSSRALESNAIGTKIFEGTVADFCQGREHLVLRFAQEQLEDNYAKQD